MFSALKVQAYIIYFPFLMIFHHLTDVGNPVFITCPTSVSFDLAEGESTELVSFVEPVVQDNSQETITPVLVTLSNPARLGYGEHVVMYNATDAAGNMAEPCVFTVFVNGRSLLSRSH